MDLHKYLAAGKALSVESGSKSSTLELAKEMKIVSGLSNATSPRVNLLFRSNGRLRTGVITYAFLVIVIVHWVEQHCQDIVGESVLHRTYCGDRGGCDPEERRTCDTGCEAGAGHGEIRQGAK